MNKYFVSRDGKEFLWEDGKFYPAFVKSAYAVDEEVAVHYKQFSCDIELVDCEKFPSLCDVKKRRTYVRVAPFALSNVLDRLYDDKNVRNIWLSMEDSEFLISFEYLRDYERTQKNVGEMCNKGEEHE